jgi:hypothetical protein
MCDQRNHPTLKRSFRLLQQMTLTDDAVEMVDAVDHFIVIVVHL